MTTNKTDKVNSKLDEILTALPQYNLGDDPITNEPFTLEETYAMYPELAQAKADIKDLFLELVGEDERIKITDPESVDYGEYGTNTLIERAELRERIKNL
jgi:hypothetical protein